MQLRSHFSYEDCAIGISNCYWCRQMAFQALASRRLPENKTNKQN